MNWRFLIISCSLFFFMHCKPKEKNTLVSQAPKMEKTDSKTITNKDFLRIGTLKIGTQKEENQLIASYPVTAYDFINSSEEKYTLDFINEFKSEFGETGNKNPNLIAGVNFIQNFQIPFRSQNFITFLYTRFASTGGAYNAVQSVAIYDLEEKKKLMIENIFKDFESFKKFAVDVQVVAKDSLFRRLENQKNISIEEKNQLSKEIEAQLVEGTKALQKNFSSFYFTPDNQWHIIFAPHQIAPGTLGQLQLEFSPEQVEPYLNPELIEKIKNTPLPIRLNNLKFEATQVKDSIDCSIEGNCIALTFDDGPSQFTEQLLDTLKNYNAKATFFVIGQNAQHQPDILRRIINEGHLIGNHSFNHKDFSRISNEEIKLEVSQTDEIIQKITGYQPEFFRFPFNLYRPEILNLIHKPIISYTLDTKDWKNRNIDSLTNTLSQPPSNSIILAHDINSTTPQAVGRALQKYKEKGIHVVSLKHLLAHQKLKKHQIYFSGKKSN